LEGTLLENDHIGDHEEERRTTLRRIIGNWVKGWEVDRTD
jgi:hypothetical protein